MLAIILSIKIKYSINVFLNINIIKYLSIFNIYYYKDGVFCG